MEQDPLYICLADDDASDRLLFTEAFSELQIKTIVSTVKNGVELMDYLNTDNIRIPDLVFIDLNMPRKNGLECLKDIRSTKRFKDVFVAIYSTSGNDSDMGKHFLMAQTFILQNPVILISLKRS